MSAYSNCKLCGRILQVVDSPMANPLCTDCDVTGTERSHMAGEFEEEKPRRSRHRDDDDRDDEDDDIDVSKPKEPMPHNYLTECILVLICCCPLFGIIGLVNATQVATHYNKGDYEKAVKASDQAKLWCILGAVLGLPAQVGIVALQIFLDAH